MICWLCFIRLPLVSPVLLARDRLFKQDSASRTVMGLFEHQALVSIMQLPGVGSEIVGTEQSESIRGECRFGPIRMSNVENE
jgi:hypothetical protein